MRKNPKVLFFIRGPVPTPEQEEEAEAVRGTVCFRNANFITDDHDPEEFDEVMGDVPRAYAIKAREKRPEIEPEAPASEPPASGSRLGPGKVAAPASGAGSAWKPNA